MAEVTYYFDEVDFGKGEAGWRWLYTDPNMIDGDLGTFAEEVTDGDYSWLALNTCLGTDLGTITKVELRAYGYGDGNDRIDLKPYYYETENFGDEHPLTMPDTAGWSLYADITNDPNMPSWTFPNIRDYLGVWVEMDKVGKGNTMYCAKVEIRVTYTPVGPPEKVTQYLAGLDLPIFPHQMDLVSNKLPCPPPY